VATGREPDLSLFVDIVHSLEAIGARYVIIGAFAASAYGITRMTYDIDIVVDLSEADIEALVSRYPSPRYYADPEQMRSSIQMGIMFNIIDSERGEKADLLPVTMHLEYRRLLASRVREEMKAPGCPPFDAWIARLQDVIIGKLEAWREGRSRKHETDIYEMLVFHYLGLDPTQPFNEHAVDQAAEALGPEAEELWLAAKQAAHEEASRLAE